MDENKKKIEKIYSRSRLRIPKIEWFITKKEISKYYDKKVNDKESGKYQNKNINKEKARKIIKICSTLCIAFLVANMILRAIEPIINAQCVSMAKSIATKISNEQATAVMAKYSYEDLMRITKDENGNVKLMSANMIVMNQIISDVPILIQNELEKLENNKFYIRLGSFTGSKILAGRGPNVEIKMSVIGDIETDLKSEFSEAGINQTLHRIYLEVRCHVTILTPVQSIEEEIINQVLLAEGIIVGDIPSTYYNLEGLTQSNLVDIVE